MKIVTPEQMRTLDQRTIADAGISGIELMDRAGKGLAQCIERRSRFSGKPTCCVHFVAGHGNNGGDAFVAARYLHERGFQIALWLAADPAKVKGDALHHLKRAQACGLEAEVFPGATPACGVVADIVVDGLLGTGAKGAPTGPVLAAIKYINAQAARSIIMAIDVPSGIDAVSGGVHADAVEADLTVTMGLPKTGLLQPSSQSFVGSLELVELGIPEAYIAEVEHDYPADVISPPSIRPLFPKRSRNTHKGTYGHVLLIGGAAGYAGSISLATQAALRSGVGVVTTMVPQGIAPIVAGSALEAMVRAVPETEEGTLDLEAWNHVRHDLEKFDALMIGPGLTCHRQVLLLIRQIIRDCTIPLVMDADALNVLEGQPHWIEKLAAPVVITPHPGEMARLFSQSIEEVQADRIGVAQAAAKFTDSTVVLKGAGTIVAESEKRPCINSSGNSGMATGGTGDVLAGLLAGLLAQGLAPFDAARAAVYLHGRAGDIASWQSSEAGLTAGDVIEMIPYAFRELSGR